ncbi:hypothetical protein CEXT_102471, partial [Caerostris extrusa]
DPYLNSCNEMRIRHGSKDQNFNKKNCISHIVKPGDTLQGIMLAVWSEFTPELRKSSIACVHGMSNLLACVHYSK